MGLFDKVKKQLGNAAETAKKAAENLPDSVKELDAEKTLKLQEWLLTKQTICGLPIVNVEIC